MIFMGIVFPVLAEIILNSFCPFAGNDFYEYRFPRFGRDYLNSFCPFAGNDFYEYRFPRFGRDYFKLFLSFLIIFKNPN